MQNRAMLATSANDNQRQSAGMGVMSQLQYEANVTVGASTLTASSILAGIINRSGSVAGYIDTLPTVAQLVAACPTLSVGDSFSFIIRNTVAQALTLAVGTGWTLGSNTAIAASLVRQYLVTMTAVKPTTVVVGTTTNASVTVTGLTESQCRAVEPGMVVAGTGITAGTKIIAVNADTLSIVLDTAATATGTTVALTCDPTATIEGVRSSTL